MAHIASRSKEMRRIALIALGFAWLGGCGDTSAPPENTAEKAPAQAKAAQPQKVEQNKFSPDEKLSYSLGARLGRGMKADHLDLNYDFLVKGIEDVLEGRRPPLNEEEKEELRLLRYKMGRAKTKAIEAERKKAYEARVAQWEAQAEKNRREGEQFLEKNVQEEGVKELASGLQYKVLREGKGPRPTLKDRIRVHYRGTYLDGEVFDETKEDHPRTFPLVRMIEGWKQGITLMREGAKYRFFVPPELGYGKGDMQSAMRPNATLIFEVELVRVFKSGE